MSDLWRYRGTPHYLGAQARRLGVSQVLADRARHNPEIYRCSVLMSQLCERYHKARKESGRPVFGRPDLLQVEGTLNQCEQELQKLHILAAAAQAILDEAWAAFSLQRPKRPYSVTSELDDIPHTNGRPMPADAALKHVEA